jgi:hypothetical protein
MKHILVHITNQTRKKNSNRDNSLPPPLCRQDTKKGKRAMKRRSDVGYSSSSISSSSLAYASLSSSEETRVVPMAKATNSAGVSEP